MQDPHREAHVFINKSDHPGMSPEVGLILRGTEIVDFGGELCPGLSIPPSKARVLAGALLEAADRAESVEEQEED